MHLLNIIRYSAELSTFMIPRNSHNNFIKLVLLFLILQTSKLSLHPASVNQVQGFLILKALLLNYFVGGRCPLLMHQDTHPSVESWCHNLIATLEVIRGTLLNLSHP